MSISCSLFLASTLALSAIVSGEPIFGGENVCNKTITVRRDKAVEEPVKYELQYSGLCGILPCTKTRVETRMDYKLRTTLEEMDVAVCCPGYAETPDRQCSPICLKPCNNGICAAPGQCKCTPEPTETSPGYVGSACNRFSCLASNRWGTKCDRECNCPANSYCSASTGKCICRTGWRGANCTEECDSTMNCDDVELPPIIEPDSNIISDSMLIQAQKMESLAPRALLRENEISDDQKSSYNLNSLNATMNLFLSMTLIGIIIFLIWRKRSGQRNDIYYGTSSNSGSSGGNSSSNYASQSYYTNGSTATSVQNRPRMPTPPEAGLFAKNLLSFDAATRSLLKGDDSLKNLESVKVDSRIEAHLINSQEASKQNLYSDIDQSFTNKSFDQTADSAAFNKSVLGNQMLCINTADPTSHYQVPKSPATRTMTTIENNTSHDEEQQTSGIYENADQNLYEEIKPRSFNERK